MSAPRNSSITSCFKPTGAVERKNEVIGETPNITAASDASKKAASDSPPPSKKLKLTTNYHPPHLDYRHVPSDWLDEVEDTQAERKKLQLTYYKGDMFAVAPKGCLLIHACNTQGHWGAGVAKTFKLTYPKAYADHNKFCTKEHRKSNPVPTGSTQLLGPRDGDRQHWIGCVFTSAKYGKAKDKPDVIISNTVKSMQMLLELVNQVDDDITDIRMCKINSGKFGVPWEKTEEALQSIVMKGSWRTSIEVWEPAE
ncbi:ADP-ribose 1''-phosphate phosphatase [Neodidymelliopsis sp. IMI 364377]|nr:ADP-ribose 1''-phosphate phosphatase [Neodidymelliopsis sp. IMI 364377]